MIKIAWLIGNQNYSRVRNAPKDQDPKPGFKDLTQVPEDIKKMEELFKELKFDHVYTSLDHSVKDIRCEFQDRKRDLEIADTDPTKKTLLYVYYSGHGVIIRGMTHIVMNEEDSFSQRYYPLQKNLTVLKGFHNTYIVVVFDCCREAITVPTRGDD